MKTYKFIAIALVSLTIFSCNNRVSQKNLETKIDSVSYALGMDMAYKLKTNFGKLDTDLFIQGYVNGIDSTGLLLNTKDLEIITAYYQQRRMDAINKKYLQSSKDLEIQYGPNKVRGEEFIAYNKSKKGILSTASGLQYLVLKEGKGESPTATSRVRVHYTGKIINGTVFESSRKNNKPSEFNLNQVIKGWTEGIQLMKTGSKFRFFIPQELAYGSTYKSNLIQPFSALVFDIELLEIVKK